MSDHKGLFMGFYGHAGFAAATTGAPGVSSSLVVKSPMVVVIMPSLS
jgi:hypothetical protein